MLKFNSFFLNRYALLGGVLVGFTVLSLGSCDTRIEGCTNVNASNFNLNADTPCSNCCTQPQATTSFICKTDANTFSTNDIFKDVNNTSYKVKNFNLYINNIEFELKNGTKVKASTSFDYNGTSYINDFFIMNNALQITKLFNIAMPDSLVAVSVNIGLPNALNTIDKITGISESSQINSNEMKEPNTGQRLSWVMTYNLLNSTNNVKLGGTNTLLNLRKQLPKALFKKGKDVKLVLTLNMTNLFQGLDLQGSTQQTNTLINSSLPNAISLLVE